MVVVSCVAVVLAFDCPPLDLAGSFGADVFFVFNCSRSRSLGLGLAVLSLFLLTLLVFGYTFGLARG